jgi:transitional endoplasmic reticulum ATPase
MNSKYQEPILSAYEEAIQKCPFDLSLKKEFAEALVERELYEDAYFLLSEILDHDSDLEAERLMETVKEHIHFADVIESSSKAPSSEQLKKTQKVSFSDVVGMQDVKEAIRMDIIYPYLQPELFAAYGREAGGGGTMLYGPPGCGKTLIAKAIAGEMGVNFMSLSMHDLLSVGFGESEKAIAEAFANARRNAPCVLFIDEVDAIAPARGQGSFLANTIVTELLTQLDGVSSDNRGVLFIGATNLPWEVDDALRRPGRFSRQIFVGAPDEEARSRMFAMELFKIPHTVTDVESLVKVTHHMSGADINGAILIATDKALRTAVRTGRVTPVSQEMLEEACREARSSILSWFDNAKAYVNYANSAGRYDAIAAYMDKEGLR